MSRNLRFWILAVMLIGGLGLVSFVSAIGCGDSSCVDDCQAEFPSGTERDQCITLCEETGEA
jgi:hypothetical protein